MPRWDIIQACIPLSVTFRLQLSCLNIMDDSSQVIKLFKLRKKIDSFFLRVKYGDVTLTHKNNI